MFGLNFSQGVVASSTLPLLVPEEQFDLLLSNVDELAPAEKLLLSGAAQTDTDVLDLEGTY